MKQEIHFHTKQQIEGYLLDAAEVLKGFPFTPSELEVLFPIVIQLLAQKQVIFEQPATIPHLLGPKL